MKNFKSLFIKIFIYLKLNKYLRSLIRILLLISFLLFFNFLLPTVLAEEISDQLSSDSEKTSSDTGKSSPAQEKDSSSASTVKKILIASLILVTLGAGYYIIKYLIQSGWFGNSNDISSSSSSSSSPSSSSSSSPSSSSSSSPAESRSSSPSLPAETPASSPTKSQSPSPSLPAGTPSPSTPQKAASFKILQVLINHNFELSITRDRDAISEIHSFYGLDAFDMHSELELVWHLQGYTEVMFPHMPETRIHKLASDYLAANYIWCEEIRRGHVYNEEESIFIYERIKKIYQQKLQK